MSDNPVWTDCMVDLETTGTDQQFNAIIQIAAVKFNPKTQEISHDFFDRCLMIAPNRYWQESCVQWWSERKPSVLQGIMARMEDPATVLTALRDWSGGGGLRMWGKPSHFDHSFLDTYYKQFGMQTPFHFRATNDMNTFIRARYWPENPPNWEADIPFEGEKHNALHDVLHQLKVLFHVMENTTSAQLVPA